MSWMNSIILAIGLNQTVFIALVWLTFGALAYWLYPRAHKRQISQAKIFQRFIIPLAANGVKVQGGGFSIANRVCMAPMTRRSAGPGDSGCVTSEMVEYYGRRAAGGVGLIITEGAHIDTVHSNDCLTAPRLETKEQLESWKPLVREIHRHGSLIFPQLWHTGHKALQPIGPSAIKKEPDLVQMTDKHFSQVISSFVSAAVACKSIGCDGIELHGAHGYLLDAFMDEERNKRTDKYGGSFENRMTFPLQVVRAVREAVGPEFPISYRFSQWTVDDYYRIKYQTPEDLKLWSCALRDAGVTMLHVSTRDALWPGFPDVDTQKPLVTWAKELCGLPCIAVGRVSVSHSFGGHNRDVDRSFLNPQPYLNLIEYGGADMLCVGRALIANPDWVQVVRRGMWWSLRPYDKGLLSSLD